MSDSETEYKDDDYVETTFSDEEEEFVAKLEVDDEQELDVANLDDEFGGSDEEEQKVVDIKRFEKKLKPNPKAFEKVVREVTRLTPMSGKGLLVLNEKTIQVSIDVLQNYLLRINSSIEPSVAKEIQEKIVSESTIGGVNYFVNELAKYLTVFGFAREVHFDKLLAELSQPRVNVANIVQSVTDNASNFSENLIGQKRSEIFNAMNSVLNPTLRTKTTPINITRLPPLKEVVLYVPTPQPDVPQEVIMEEQGQEIQEEEEYESPDFVFFMNVLDTYQRTANQQKLSQLTPMKQQRKSKLKEPMSKFDKLRSDVQTAFRLRNDSELKAKAEEARLEEEERKRILEEQTKVDVVKEPKRKPGRPPGSSKGGGGKGPKHVGGKQFSPEIIHCKFCNNLIGEVQVRSIEQNKKLEYDKVQFCSFTCLDNYKFQTHFRSKKI